MFLFPFTLIYRALLRFKVYKGQEMFNYAFEQTLLAFELSNLKNCQFLSKF